MIFFLFGEQLIFFKCILVAFVSLIFHFFNRIFQTKSFFDFLQIIFANNISCLHISFNYELINTRVNIVSNVFLPNVRKGLEGIKGFDGEVILFWLWRRTSLQHPLEDTLIVCFWNFGSHFELFMKYAWSNVFEDH